MAKYERKEKELFQVVEDTLSICGELTRDVDVSIYALVAFDHSTGKWVKFAKETHKSGYAIAMLKAERGTQFDNTGKEAVVPLLKMGIVNKSLVEKAVGGSEQLDNEIIGICLAQGLVIL